MPFAAGKDARLGCPCAWRGRTYSQPDVHRYADCGRLVERPRGIGHPELPQKPETGLAPFPSLPFPYHQGAKFNSIYTAFCNSGEVSLRSSQTITRVPRHVQQGIPSALRRQSYASLHKKHLPPKFLKRRHNLPCSIAFGSPILIRK